MSERTRIPRPTNIKPRGNSEGDEPTHIPGLTDIKPSGNSEGDEPTRIPRPTNIKPRGNSEGYRVGYKKPPLNTRFKAGESGNPAGRRKGLRNLATDVKRTLARPVKVKTDGGTRKISTQEILLLVLRDKAVGGDARALDRAFQLAQRFNSEDADAGSGQPLPADDQAILDAYVAARIAAGGEGVISPMEGSSEDSTLQGDTPARNDGASSEKKERT